MLSKFGLPLSSNVLLTKPCNACSINKMHKLPFSTSTLTSSSPLDIVFSDVWTSPIISIDNFKYYVIFVDHYTRYTWFYPLKRKSDVSDVFKRFKVLVENRFQSKLRTLYTDNGGEYIALTAFLADNGISHFTTPPHTPEHNGISERKHRHTVETGLALLSHASMPKGYWTYALATAVYLINRMATATLSMKSPFESLFRQVANYSKLRIFGCLCFPWLRPYTSHKLDSRSTPCVFLGYSTTQSAYFCLDRATSRIYTSRHVVFHEYVYPFSLPTPLTSENHTEVVDADSSQTAGPTGGPTVQAVPIQAPTSNIPTEPLPQEPATVPAPAPTSPATPSATTATPTTTAPENVIPLPISPQPLIPQPQPVLQQQQQPASTLTISQPLPTRQPTRTSQRTRKPVDKLNLSAVVNIGSEKIPTSVAEALKDPRWRQAMIDEINAQLRNHTWDLESPHRAANVVGCKWVFTIKRKADGTVERFKARLVAKGFNQKPGIDYHDTFSPVVKPATIRLVLSVATSHNWPLRQFDVNHAFLQGKLEDNVYMLQPPGFVDKDNPTAVCKLHKAIYGLKQAPRAWYNELRRFLLASGFTNSLADASLFIYNKNGVLLYMLIYVDDIILTGNNQTHLNNFITSLSTRFSLKDLGQLSYFLGIEAHYSSQGLLLTQHRYIADLLNRNKMVDCNTVPTPMCPYKHLTLGSGTSLKDPTQYRATVGSLQYLSLTRPDISFAVNKMSQFMHKPTDEHWNGVKRILRYLAGTMTTGIFLHKHNTPSLHAYTDADWAGNRDDYTSTGAYIVYYGKHPIAWSSKKQTTVARSSTEAEYRSIASTASEVCWVISLITELGLKQLTTPAIYCDNIGATYLAANPVFHSRMKHLALDYHFVRNHVQGGRIRVSHVTSADQLADALTKPLPRGKHQSLCNKIGLAKGGPS
ncbi:hypothetical protein Bca101_002354 [Brassica carinata]